MSQTLTFAQRYKGPLGPHLDHRTYFTQTGKPAPLETQRSMHPRNAEFRIIGVKLNTAKPRRSAEQQATSRNPFGVRHSRKGAK